MIRLSILLITVRCRQTELCVPIVADWQPEHWIDCDEGQTMFVIDTKLKFSSSPISQTLKIRPLRNMFEACDSHLALYVQQRNDKCLINVQNIL